MKIVVCVKIVPDSAASMSVEDGNISWGDAPMVINPWDEYAVEAALQLSEAHGGDVVAISMGDENAKDALKHALAMGCSEAILVTDPALEVNDSLGAAKVLAAGVKKVGDADLVLFGKQAIDSDTGIVAAQTARILDFSALTLIANISELDPETNSITAERAMEEGRQVIKGKLPAVISVVKDFGEPRYPSFMGIRKAAKAEIPLWSLGDLGIDPPSAKVIWEEVLSPPKREISNEIISGGSPEEIAGALADKIMEEKVL